MHVQYNIKLNRRLCLRIYVRNATDCITAYSKKMASELTAEQIKRIEENRKKALEKRAAKLNIESQSVSSISKNLPAIADGLHPTKSTVSFYGHSFSPTLNKQSSKSGLDVCNYTHKKLNSPSGCQNDNGTSSSTINGCCKLISRDRFSVVVSYHQASVNVFKTIKGASYDSSQRTWNFPLTEYYNFRNATNVLKPHVSIGCLPKIVLDTFFKKDKQSQMDIKTIDISRIEERLRYNAYSFQIEGIQFGISKNGRCLIADDMGLGKTIQALGIADYYRTDWPLLIVCPSSMRFQWEEEIRKNLPSIPLYEVFVMTKGKDSFENVKILILSYDLMGRLKDSIKTVGFGVAILDESHSLKSSRAQRTIAALDLIKSCKRVILISGTPALSRPRELHTQLKALDPQNFSNFIEFGIRYCDGKKDRFGWNFGGSSNMEELRLILEERYMIRRLKSEVLTQLPSKIRQIILLNNDSINVSTMAMNAFAKKLQAGTLKGMEKRGTLLCYFAETGRAKIKAVCEYIVSLLSDGKKFLCFAHHADVLDAISNTLEDNKTYYIRIDGSVSAEERKLLCDRFQYEDKFKVAVLSIKAANTGITLTAAQLVVFAELFWNPGELIQAEDRAHRIGQQDSVLVQYLMAKGTADDYLWPLIQSKLDVLQKAGLSKDIFTDIDSTVVIKEKMKQTTIDDFASILDGTDDEALMNVVDEIEGVPEKKRKLSM